MEKKYDVVINNGMVIDGAGNPYVRKDLAIKDGVIVRIGSISPQEGRLSIDASQRVVCPGFIDLHNHCDQGILPFPQAESSVLQGVTTSVAGNCGLSMAPVEPMRLDLLVKYNLPFLHPGFDYEWDWKSFGEYYQKVQERGMGQNLAPFVGQGTIRIAVKGFDSSPASPEEMAQMKKLLERSMEEGAFGISTGLIYPPGNFTGTEELIELTSVLKKYMGVYASHLRNESYQLIESVDEAIRIGETNSIPVEISHHKAIGRANWGKVNATLRIMQEARERGVEVSCDVYPYIAASTTVSSLLPGWALEGGIQKMLGRLSDTGSRKKIKEDILSGEMVGENCIKSIGWENLYITDCSRDKPQEGKNFREIFSSAANGDEIFDKFFDWLLSIEGEAKMAMFGMCEEDLKTILRCPFSSVISDSWVTGPSAGGKPHPRAYGTFPRVLGKYVREEKVLSLEEAIRKMTSMPAGKIGLRKRGLLAEGFYADLVIFDPDNISDRATYQSPHQYPQGISHVFVNGTMVVKEGELTGKRPGKVLSRS